MTSKIVPVVMAGGKGTRLWPLSRASAPKQFIRFTDDRTLFQNTLLRVADSSIYEQPLVITNEDFRFLVAEQAREIDILLSATLLEPEVKNTAAAVAAAAIFVSSRFGENAILQVLASDHEIVADDEYFNAIEIAKNTVSLGKIVTFGITPTEPATGYGYIEVGEKLPTHAHAVRRFVEKPGLHQAEAMLKRGGYTWNSGIFVFSAGQLLDEMSAYTPDVVSAVSQAIDKAERDQDFVRLERQAFGASPDISIDYGLMERTPNAAVVQSSFLWSDMGSWDAVWKLGTRDDAGNVTIGNTTLSNTRNCLVMSRASHLALQGLEGLAVVASEDAVYVGRLEESQDVGKLVKHLASAEATAALTKVHPTSHRPWGGHTTVYKGDRFLVNRLYVGPGRSTSLQRHHHRSEHWICVKGFAEVTIGEQVAALRENESVYIPPGSLHRISNPGKIELEVIAVQTDSYLEQDGVVRVAEVFRTST